MRGTVVIGGALILVGLFLIYSGATGQANKVLGK